MNGYRELPINQDMNPWILLHAIPGKSPTDVISLLHLCGYEVLIDDSPPPRTRPHDHTRDLFVAILDRAVQDALFSHGKPKWDACWFLFEDSEWFPVCCNVLDLDYRIVRRLLSEKLEKEPSHVAH